MEFLARLLRYLFWVAVVSWSVSLLRRLVNHTGTGVGYAPSDRTVDVTNDAVSQKLVRDPVCGMHIAEGLALPLRQGAEMLHFCSAECRDKYVSENRKFAANA
jgi:YHS domain-containing protein